MARILSTGNKWGSPLDVYASPQDCYLNGDVTTYTCSVGTGGIQLIYFHVEVGTAANKPAAGAVWTFKLNISNKNVLVQSFTIDSALRRGLFTLGPFLMIHASIVSMTVESDNAGDTSEYVGPIDVCTSDAIDPNGRVDVGKLLGTTMATPDTAGVQKVSVEEWLGTTVEESTAGIPDVNVVAVGDAVPMSAADVESECDDAIEANISIAAILEDTGTTLDGIVDDIKSYLVDGGRIDLLLDDIKILMRSDKVIDTSGSPWVTDYFVEGTTSNPVMSKTMKNTDNENVTTKNNVLGKLQQE